MTTRGGEAECRYQLVLYQIHPCTQQQGGGRRFSQLVLPIGFKKCARRTLFTLSPMNPFVREINFAVPGSQRIRTDSQRACGGDVGRAKVAFNDVVLFVYQHPHLVDGFPIRPVGVNGGIPSKTIELNCLESLLRQMRAYRCLCASLPLYGQPRKRSRFGACILDDFKCLFHRVGYLSSSFRRCFRSF
jgi:hypothetical protein